MELHEILGRFDEAIHLVDRTTTIENESRSGSGKYLPSVGTLYEEQCCAELMDAWARSHPAELPGYSKKDWLEVRYSAAKSAACDICVVTPGFVPTPTIQFEWAIEMKYVRFVGDNGKVNDYGVGKVVSPYRFERSSVLDAERLQSWPHSARKAIVMYGFEYDAASVPHAQALAVRDSISSERADNLSKSLHREDPTSHSLNMDPLIDLFEAAAATRGIRLSPVAVKKFSGLSRHPIYRMGKLIAWEVL